MHPISYRFGYMDQTELDLKWAIQFPFNLLHLCGFYIIQFFMKYFHFALSLDGHLKIIVPNVALFIQCTIIWALYSASIWQRMNGTIIYAMYYGIIYALDGTIM